MAESAIAEGILGRERKMWVRISFGNASKCILWVEDGGGNVEFAAIERVRVVSTFRLSLFKSFEGGVGIGRAPDDGLGRLAVKTRAHRITTPPWGL